MSEHWVATYRAVRSLMSTTVTTGHDEERHKVNLAVLTFEVQPMYGKDQVRLMMERNTLDQMIEALTLLREDLPSE